ncbi:MAG: hypothetical protein EOO06_13545 [Chitinophagaceae bacterium]|nr:MAG: hypothetical protein EOO06_13545 [Chitinophagaceae bacterium]
MSAIPFQVIDWQTIDETEHKGETGSSTWKTISVDGLRVRLVTYSPGYLADHWCQKGHLVHCLEGSVETSLSSGEKHTLTKGMSYLVSDDLSSHQSSSDDGVSLLIVDGDFLKTTLPQQSPAEDLAPGPGSS